MSEHAIATASPSAPAAPPAAEWRGAGRAVLVLCGILAAALYTAMMLAIRYEGYDPLSQTVSELSAVGAPTRALWFWLAWGYTALMLAFGWGVWKSAGRRRALRVVGALVLASSLLGFVWPFAPMHQRAVLAAGGGTLSDAAHIALGAVTVLLFLTTVGVGAAAFGRPFRYFSLATLVVLLAFGALTGLDAPRLAADLATPWLGLYERINIGAYMLWSAVLAVAVLRRPWSPPAP